mmetsp:Transcript_34806/g.69373  ORF Transcript_34806/g.69373 Transcript_34806/m.69373 type:complete len:374 (-) Transcript_34806:393-1514(-)
MGTDIPASKFGVALVSWLMACVAVACGGSPMNPHLFARLAALVLGILGAVALNQTRLLRAERETSRALATRRNELGLALMKARNNYMHTAESVRIGRSMKPRSDDIFIVTYPKCGTTWMTQICHQLRTGGTDAFGEITEVVPWDILAHDCKQDLDTDQVASPRLFKSHEGWATIPKGAKYVYVARDPQDAFFSFYKFLPGYVGLAEDDIDEETFANAIFAGASHSGQIWDHMLGWWDKRHSPNVLLVFYEDLKEDLQREVVRVAQFMGHDMSELEAIKQAIHRSSFAHMAARENAHHFDDHFVRSHTLPMMGLATDTPTRVSKVRKGGGDVGSQRELPPAIAERLRTKWQSIMSKPTGCADYAALRERFRLGQ